MRQRRQSETCEMPRFGAVRRLLGALAAVALLAGCGGTQGPSAPATQAPAASQPSSQAAPAAAAAPDHVVLRLDYSLVGYHAPFFLAAAKGFYADKHLNVDVEEGKGSVTTIETVANGSDTFGLADGGALIQSVGKGMPVIAVAGMVGKTAMSVLVLAKSSIKTPRDLEGHLFGGTPGGAAESLFPAFAKANGVDASKIKSVTVAGSAKGQALAAGKVDAITSFYDTQMVQIEQQGIPVRAFPYADYGVNVPGMVLLTARSYAAQHPDVVKRFVAASVQGFEYAQAHPEEAAAVAHQKFPAVPETLILKEWQAALPLLRTKAAAGKPIGWMSPDDWKQSVQLELQAGLIKQAIPVDEIMTDQYVGL